MAPAILIYEPNERALEKQLSRDLDALRLREGDISSGELARENGFFSSLPLHEFRLVSVGRRRLRAAA